MNCFASRVWLAAYCLLLLDFFCISSENCCRNSKLLVPELSEPLNSVISLLLVMKFGRGPWWKKVKIVAPFIMSLWTKKKHQVHQTMLKKFTKTYTTIFSAGKGQGAQKKQKINNIQKNRNQTNNTKNLVENSSLIYTC